MLAGPQAGSSFRSGGNEDVVASNVEILIREGQEGRRFLDQHPQRRFCQGQRPRDGFLPDVSVYMYSSSVNISVRCHQFRVKL